MKKVYHHYKIEKLRATSEYCSISTIHICLFEALFKTETVLGTSFGCSVDVNIFQPRLGIVYLSRYYDLVTKL